MYDPCTHLHSSRLKSAQDGSITRNIFLPSKNTAESLTPFNLADPKCREVRDAYPPLAWHDSLTRVSDSISDHMYRMAVLAMCTSDTALDVSKCVVSIVDELWFMVMFEDAL